MTNGYVLGQLAQAFLTATEHEDPDVRRRADRRAARWGEALAAMADGRVVVGSRTPVRGLPAWVTTDILRGGFATGRAAAEIPLQPEEVALARRLEIPATRAMIFGYYVSEAGLQELRTLLDSGCFRVEIPEDAALLTVAWLLRSGDRGAALEVLDALSPFIERFRLAPKVAPVTTVAPDHVCRSTAGEATRILTGRTPNARVEAQREALAVWNPLTDRALGLWLERYRDGRIAFDADPVWLRRAAALVAEYDRLVTVHTRCSKHRRPKENLAILLRALRAAAEDAEIAARDVGLLHRAVEGSLRKRGAPGSEPHATLRSVQGETARRPAHHQLATLAAERLLPFDPAAGLEHPEQLTVAVTAEESATSGLPRGSSLPPVVSRVLGRAHSAPVERLLELGVVPSAEVLAALIPQISATVVAAAMPDQALGRLAAANYRAFRRRRSVLLLDLQKQVQLSELPWVRAVGRHGGSGTDEPLAVARRVGALVLDRFPGTILPNPLVQELSYLLSAAGHDVPLVEELAADIFTGRFTDTFRRSAEIAAGVVGGTLYARYYRIDVEEVTTLTPANGRWFPRLLRPRVPRGGRSQTFADLCHTRAGRSPATSWSVAANGRVIEQAQILTTHNLAALVGLGIAPPRGWIASAVDAIDRTADLLDRASRQQRPLRTVKDAAYAWRQAVFYLSVADPRDTRELLADDTLGTGRPAVVRELMEDLRAVAGGRSADLARTPFLGWTVKPHWVLERAGRR